MRDMRTSTMDERIRRHRLRHRLRRPSNRFLGNLHVHHQSRRIILNLDRDLHHPTLQLTVAPVRSKMKFVPTLQTLNNRVQICANAIDRRDVFDYARQRHSGLRALDSSHQIALHRHVHSLTSSCLNYTSALLRVRQKRYHVRLKVVPRRARVHHNFDFLCNNSR